LTARARASRSLTERIASFLAEAGQMFIRSVICRRRNFLPPSFVICVLMYTIPYCIWIFLCWQDSCPPGPHVKFI
jgi:hypothetical protein